MKTLKDNLYIQIFVIYTRYLIGATFVFASIIKIKGKRFTGSSGELEPINSAWHFFETLYQSGLYWQFLGISQFIAGALLLTQKFSFLGALLFLPICTNIFMITLSYYFAFTPIITGLLLLTNMFLLIWDWDRLKVLFNFPSNNQKVYGIENETIWTYTGLVLLVFTTIYKMLFDDYNVILWGVFSFVIGLVGLILWKLNSRETEKV